jgi:hypothetical protein
MFHRMVWVAGVTGYFVLINELGLSQNIIAGE